MRNVLLAGTILAGVGAAAFLGFRAWRSDSSIAILCPVFATFEPQPDITAYELAAIVQGMNVGLGRGVCVAPDHPIPPSLLRHFKISGVK